MSDTLKRTVCVPLDPCGHEVVLSETATAFNAAASWIAFVCWHEDITNNTVAHKRVYAETRSRFGLGAQFAEAARMKAMEALAAERAKEGAHRPTFSPQASIRYDARTYRVRALDRVSLSTLHGRITCRLVPGHYQHQMLVDPDWQIGGAELIQRRGQWFLHVTQHKPAPPIPEPTGYLGVDLGLANIATDSTGAPFTGAPVRAVRERRCRQRRRMQKTNTRRSRARLRKAGRREARFQRNINHIVANALVAKAHAACNALALEHLTGINARTRVKKADREQRMRWAFYQLRLFVEQKARRAGVRVVFVDPRNTSRTCSRPECGYCDKRNRVDQAHFRCLSCGFATNADVNAAINIAMRAAVNQPIVLPPLHPRGPSGPGAAIASTSSPF